jgi:fibronectin type 3 domain-containing protein
VSGSSNTSVTWSATGGSVSSSGLYTAPNIAGSFTVKATSVADNTKSASATVTVSAPLQHAVTLTWTASTSSVTGYNIYRGTASGGPYTQTNTALNAPTNYVDNTVQSGTTYFYVVTSVDANAVESAFSNQVSVAVPTP